MKSARSRGTKFDKINNADDLDQYTEFDENDNDALLADGMVDNKPKSGKRDHEIYDNTYYIPNDKLRLLEIPMNSNLTF